MGWVRQEDESVTVDRDMRQSIRILHDTINNTIHDTTPDTRHPIDDRR